MKTLIIDGGAAAVTEFAMLLFRSKLGDDIQIVSPEEAKQQGIVANKAKQVYRLEPTYLTFKQRMAYVLHKAGPLKSKKIA